MRNETVLVTGAAGTVGAYAVRELVERGHRVIAHDRPGSRFELDLPEGAPVEVRTGDLRDLAACVDAVKGAQAVVHIAATVDLALPRDEIMAINRDAVRFLYEAARAAGARRFVFLSSGSIYRKLPGPATEDREIAPQTDYEESKTQAEEYLFSRPRSGTEVVVLRPTMIYGPRARFLGVKMATLPPMLALAFPRVPRLRGGPVCNWIHGEDVARAAALVLDEPRAAWEAYNVADEAPMSLGEVVEAITRCYGLPLGPEVPYPMGLMSLVGPRLAGNRAAVAVAAQGGSAAWSFVVRRYGLEPIVDGAVDRESFLYSAIEAVFDTTRLRALGFRCKYRSLRDGYPEVMRWYQAHRWLPTYPSDAPRAGAVSVRFAETMAGTWHRAGTPEGVERLFRFSVSAEAPDLTRFLADGAVELDGLLEAGGLASSRPCRGRLHIKPFSSPRTLRYQLSFEGDDGHRYRFEGEKTLDLLHLVRTMTTLPGQVLDAGGDPVGTCLLRFDLRGDLLSFLSSWGLHTGVVHAASSAPPADAPASRSPRPPQLAAS